MNITKTQSQSIKGGAVILMIAHHLFYYPSKEYAALISGIPCEHALGIFGKICVPMFLIVSGYGLSVKGDFSYGSMMRKIYAFLKIYWFYYFPFVIGGFLLARYFPWLGINQTIYCFDAFNFITDALGITSIYNGAWWFVGCYILCVLLFPILHKLVRRFPVLTISSGFVLYIISRYVLPTDNSDPISNVIRWNCSFSMGIAMYLFRQEISLFVQKYRYSSAAAFVIVIILAFAKNTGVMLGAPFLIYLMTKLNPAGYADKILNFFGRYSTPIWFIHPFFINYYFHKIAFASANPVFIYGEAVVVSLLASIALEKIRIVLFHKPPACSLQ